MGYTELNGRYQALRHELDAAYAVWNSTAIDQIAEELAHVELALATAQHARGGASDRRPGTSTTFGASERV